MDEEILLPPEDGADENLNELDISLPDIDEEVITTEWQEEIKSDEKVSEESKEEDNKETEKKEEDKSEDKEKSWNDELFDLWDLFDDIQDWNDSIDKSNEAIDNIEKTWEASTEDITILKEENKNLKDWYKRMEDQLKKIANEKSDLMYKNAELEAFWWESSNPQILILSRNLEKAQAWDDRAKSKVESTLKDLLFNITGEDYDQKKTDKKADVLSAAESYNNTANPNLKNKDEDSDNEIIVM